MTVIANRQLQVNKFGIHSGHSLHSSLPQPAGTGVPARSVETAHVFKFETPNGSGDTGHDVDPASIWDEEAKLPQQSCTVMSSLSAEDPYHIP